MQLDEFCRQQNQLKKFLPYLHRAALHPFPKPCQHRWLRGSLESWIAGITEAKTASSRDFDVRAVADHQHPYIPHFCPKLMGRAPISLLGAALRANTNSLRLLWLRKTTEQRAKW